MSFIAYLSLFQCAFLITPMQFFLIFHYRFNFIDSGIFGGIILLLVGPIFIILVLNRLFAKYLYHNSRSNPTQNLMSTPERATFVVNNVMLIALSLIFFLAIGNGFLGGDIINFVILNLLQIASIITALLGVKHIRFPKSSDLGIYFALGSIGLVYLLSYKSLAFLYLGEAILAMLLFLGIWLMEKITTVNPSISYSGTEIAVEHFGWVKNEWANRLSPATFGWLLAILWSIALSSPIGAMFAYTSSTGQITFGYLIFIFMVFMGLGHFIVEKVFVNQPTKLLSTVIILLSVNFGILGLFPILKITIFDQIVSGTAMGLLLGAKVQYRVYNKRAEPTLFYGMPWATFWAAFVGFGKILSISFDISFQNIPGQVLVSALLYLFMVILLIIEPLRFKQICRVYGAKTDPL